MHRFTPALFLIALFAMPMAASDQASTATESGSASSAVHVQRGYGASKTGPHRGATMETAPAGTIAMHHGDADDRCEACMQAKRESMRGPKGGIMGPKGMSR